MFRIVSLFTLPLLLLSDIVAAEYLGLLNGRTASLAGMGEVSAELGLVTGDLDRFDYQNMAARVTYRLNTDTALIGTIGVSEFGDTDGSPYGLGVFYQLARQRISDRIDLAAKASFHTGSYDSSAPDNNAKIDSYAFEALISGRQPLATSLNWYTNVGYHHIRLERERDDSTNEFGIGAGLVYSTGQGEAYIGVDLIDKTSLGLGFRYFLP